MAGTERTHLNTTPTLPRARHAFTTFVEAMPLDARVAALHDADADGVTAGVVWQCALARAGYAHLARIVPDRERNAWTAANRARVQAAAPTHLFVLDLESRAWQACRLALLIIIARRAFPLQGEVF